MNTTPMPIGILVNVAAVVIGGLLGSVLGHKLPERIKTLLNMTFGVCAMTMGITSIILIRNMPAVFLAVILGATIGAGLKLNERVRTGVTKLVARIFPARTGQGTDNSLLITAMVLFCASGTGIYGSLVSGMEGDHSILLAKAVLDLFTAAIFACELKQTTALIAIPQLIIMLLLFFSARLILPLTNEVMIADFKACGGILLVATALTILKVKPFPLVDLIPAMILVMPISYLWTTYIVPLL